MESKEKMCTSSKRLAFRSLTLQTITSEESRGDVLALKYILLWVLLFLQMILEALLKSNQNMVFSFLVRDRGKPAHLFKNVSGSVENGDRDLSHKDSGIRQESFFLGNK